MRVDFHIAILVASVARMHGRPGHQRAPEEGRFEEAGLNWTWSSWSIWLGDIRPGSAESHLVLRRSG